MPFPLIKLGSLFIKQLSKPMANAIKRRAKESPSLRPFCMKPAQWYHWVDVNIKMKLLGLGKSKTVPKMNEDMAVELGAEMIGEGFLYTFVAFLVYAEYNYLGRGNEKKKEEEKQYLLGLENKIEELGLVTERQDAQLREMERALAYLEHKNTSLVDKLFGKEKKTS